MELSKKQSDVSFFKLLI